MSLKRRVEDMGIPDTIDGMVRELYIRQDGIIGTLDELKVALKGNGPPGLIREHEVVKADIIALKCSNEWVRNWVAGSVLALVLTFGGIIFGYGQLVHKVDMLTKAINIEWDAK